MYNKLIELSEMSKSNWLSNEVFSLGWFVMVGVLAAAYVTWLILLDKSRAVELLLIGSLAAVFYSISNTIITAVFNIVEYKIRLVPIYPPIFIAGATLTPILIMLVQQYTSSWPKYALWSGLGLAFLCFVLFPIYDAIGIADLHKGWNWIYQFLVMFVLAQITRLVFLWIEGTERRPFSRSKYSSPI